MLIHNCGGQLSSSVSLLQRPRTALKLISGEHFSFTVCIHVSRFEPGDLRRKNIYFVQRTLIGLCITLLLFCETPPSSLF